MIFEQDIPEKSSSLDWLSIAHNNTVQKNGQNE